MKKHMIAIICSIVFLLIGGAVGFVIGLKVGTVNALTAIVNKAASKASNTATEAIIKKLN